MTSRAAFLLLAALAAPAFSQTVSFSGPLSAASGQAYTGNFSLGIYTAEWSLSSGTLPTGLNLDYTGVLSGTPTVPGVYTFTVFGQSTVSASGTYTITIYGLSPTSLPDGQSGQVYSQSLSIQPSPPGTVTWSVTAGALPPGLGINAQTGVISGTPTTSNNQPYSFTVTAQSSGLAIPQAYQIAIAPGGGFISPSTLPAGTYAIAYSQTLTSSLGESYWGIVSGNLPYDLELDPYSGTISGTPYQTGTYSFLVSATSGNTVVYGQYTLVIQSSDITPSTLPNGQVGHAYTAQLTYNSEFTATFGVYSGNLPPGLTLNATSGAITGTPTTVGTYPFTIVANTDSEDPDTADYVVTIAAAAAPPSQYTIVPAAAPAAQAGQAYSLQLSVSPTPPTTPTWLVSGGILPPGLILNTQTGMISGTPTAIGTYPVTIQAQASPLVVAISYLFAVNSAGSQFVISPTTLPNATLNQSYSAPLSATPATSATLQWTVTSGSLPPGLSLNSVTGLISGTPTEAGSYGFGIVVQQNSETNVTIQAGGANYTLIVLAGPVVITQTTLPPAFLNTLYTTTLTAAGGLAPYTWTLATPNPANLSIGATTGTISGTPSATGTYNITATVTDSTGLSTSKTFSLFVGVGLSVSTKGLPNGSIGAPYSQLLQAAGGQAPYRWSITTGSLPPGLTLDMINGPITGTPTTNGSYPFTIKVTDGNGLTATQPLSITIGPGISISPATLPGGATGVAYSQTLTASNGAGSYTWAVTAGNLPAGLQLNASTGTISGTPTATGSGAFTVTVTDASTNTASQKYSIAITSPVLITTTSLPNGAVGAAYSQTVAATGGLPPYTWSVSTGTLPAGLTLASTTGVISGKPTTVGSSTFTIQAADANGTPALQSYTVTIGSGLTVTSSSFSGTLGSAFNQTLSATGGTTPYTWTSGTLPAGLSLNSSTGAITGIPTATASAPISVTVTDANKQSASANVTINITAPSAPPVSVGGVSSASPQGQQLPVTITLGTVYPVPISGTITLAFQSAVAGVSDDPTVQFATGGGGRTITFTVPANQTNANFPSGTSVPLSTGTTAGTITLTTTLTAGGTTLAPSPSPTIITIPATAPVITNVTVTSSGSTLTVAVTGYSTTRDMVSGQFTFSPAMNATLAQSSITVPLTSAFTTWYSNSSSLQYGTAFTVSIPFTVQGNASSIIAVGVTLTNSKGTSSSVSANP